MSQLVNIMQGSFVSDGFNKLISVPSGVTAFEVINLTNAADDASSSGVRFYWQQGFDDLGGVREYKDGSDVINLNICDADNPGFSEVNTSDQTIGAPIAVTAVSNAANFVVSTADTQGMATNNGVMVRLTDIATTYNTRGFDFEIGTVVANTSFTNRWALANAPGGVGGAGFWRRVYFDPIFYPRTRNIVSISKATQAVVVCSLPHGYKIGQTVRFHIPAGWGMTQLDNQTATVVAVDLAANSFTIDLNTSAYSTFTWIASSLSFDWATVAPSNMDTAVALAADVDPYNDARTNQAVIGIVLYAGAQSPAGVADDVIYWKAYTSSSVENE